MGVIEDAPKRASSVVQPSTSIALPRSTLPQEEKLNLAHRLLTVSSRMIRVLVYLLNRVVCTDLFGYSLFAGSVRAGE